MSYTYPYLNGLIDQAAGSSITIAVVYPCEEVSLRAAIGAGTRGLGKLLLVGPRERMTQVAADGGIDLSGATLVDTPDDPVAAAREAATLVAQGQAQAIMKGSLHTDELMGVLVGREAGLRTSRRISHVFLFDMADMPKPLMLTDCVVNIAPDLMVKRDIVQNAIDLAHVVGIAKPLVGILSATESVNPAIPGTLDAAALCKMADRGQITGGVLDGPLAFDNAISLESARIKKIHSPVAGHPDILLVPNLETGNTLYKSLVYLGHAECAGLVLGTRVPVILTSRADSPFSRLASVALGVLFAARKPAA
ncbi:bifunctional enoyl-CoA hydratase/phosphate acetyltransferase [Pandoraea sp.]|uniref:bifunctional enoyl-CoA hydratase/phosphate acetyltransferase n=1 Tax=Pandoraea sp. TaxID=1883445 RepID=UPI001207781B|nr:bifunctional enoyl-CoA hydratase/phosphate acetyltransferase [Pandoraea sp.]MBU6492874.1 bifunctional enoyl-CoA hydratase/phosphate acetyltransferase [Burkholderiales bacterium]MDE2288186.1 bifunctional enoyl-CoA hydratase/phosphate acetyltransferase [Burkholderiales bacterium]MDE2611208.1 bifunctional enoyl-CoA hydratase/phosphate acetyltransferase [Burkholderiales bacterium]TAL56213.1 MAG: bifunctional enoyl-CoA hydratase/phosphate acetyltransferase [Pandoraea sp.]TAM19167.1 MAG: bifuncti